MSRWLALIRSLPGADALARRLTRSPLMGRITRGSFWVFTGNFFWRLPSAITTLLAARILGPAGFGEFGMVNSTVQTFAAYAALRLGATSNRYVAENRHRDPERAARILSLTLTVSLVSCLLAAGVLALLAPWLAAATLNRPELVVPLLIGALLLFAQVFGSVQEITINGFENFRSTARVGVLRGLLTPLLCLPLAWFFGVRGMVAGLAVVATVACAWLTVLLRRERVRAGFQHPIPWAEARRELPVLWQFALPGMLTLFLVAAVQWTARVILVQRPNGYVELGLFEAANQWRAVVLFLPTVLARAVMPVLAESWGRSGDGDFARASAIQIQAVCLVSTPLAILVMGFAPYLAALFGARFAGTAIILPVLMASMVLYALNQALRASFDGAARIWINLGMHGLWALTLLGTTSALVPALGAMALAWAILAAEAVLFVLQGIYANRVLARGSLGRSAFLLFMAAVLIGLQYGAGSLLPPPYQAAVSLALAAAFGVPALARLRR